MNKNEIEIPIKDITVNAILTEPEKPAGLIIFAHGSGSGRLSPRNNFVAETLNQQDYSTLLADLLNQFEDEVYENRFDIPLLTNRLIGLTEWAMLQPSLKGLHTGYFGASTGAACALQAAAMLDRNIYAVVSRGGRPDLAKGLEHVTAPTLLIVGSLDTEVKALNNKAYQQLRCEKRFEVVEGASHLFEEPGTLHRVANLAAQWFNRYLATAIEMKS